MNLADHLRDVHGVPISAELDSDALGAYHLGLHHPTVNHRNDHDHDYAELLGAVPILADLAEVYGITLVVPPIEAVKPMDKVRAPDGFEGMVVYAAVDMPEGHVAVVWRDGSKSAEPAAQLVMIESYTD